MTEKKIRNAFVVTPDGEVEERAFEQKYTPLIANLEGLRNTLIQNREANRKDPK